MADAWIVRYWIPDDTHTHERIFVHEGLRPKRSPRRTRTGLWYVADPKDSARWWAAECRRRGWRAEFRPRH